MVVPMCLATSLSGYFSGFLTGKRNRQAPKEKVKTSTVQTVQDQGRENRCVRLRRHTCSSGRLSQPISPDSSERDCGICGYSGRRLVDKKAPQLLTGTGSGVQRNPIYVLSFNLLSLRVGVKESGMYLFGKTMPKNFERFFDSARSQYSVVFAVQGTAVAPAVRFTPK